MTEKSICIEDVFPLYERNRNIYHDCNLLGRENSCKYRYNEKCYCMEATQEVLPFLALFSYKMLPSWLVLVAYCKETKFTRKSSKTCRSSIFLLFLKFF